MWRLHLASTKRLGSVRLDHLPQRRLAILLAGVAGSYWALATAPKERPIGTLALAVGVLTLTGSAVLLSVLRRWPLALWAVTFVVPGVAVFLVEGTPHGWLVRHGGAVVSLMIGLTLSLTGIADHRYNLRSQLEARTRLARACSNEDVP